MQTNDKKQKILNSLAKIIRELRGRQSQFMLASENDISTSIISTVERALKDPQVTTLFKLAEALNIKPHKLIKMLEDDLPSNFTLIDR